ncbi:MAG TPA: dockerin type I domain-containing protein [Schlesneria sp.]|jgi:hypothetical protein
MLKQFDSLAVLCMAAAASALVAVTPAAGQVSLYHTGFTTLDATITPADGPTGFVMPDWGWTDNNSPTGTPGVFFPNTGAAPDADQNHSFVYMFGNTSANPAATQGVFISSNATTGVTANSNFPIIDPTLPANNGLGFTWGQNLQNNGGPAYTQFAVQTANGNWYLSTASFVAQALVNGVIQTTNGGGAQGPYYATSLIYNPAKANWLSLTVPTAAATAVTIGTQPSVDLTGNITGVGIVASFPNGQTTLDVDYVDVGIPPVPGDVTGDRHVTIADYNIIKANFGKTSQLRTDGDVTGDGIVNLADFAQWKANNGLFGSGSGGVTGGAVPEPSSVFLMLFGLPLGWGLLRSWKKNSVRALA